MVQNKLLICALLVTGMAQATAPIKQADLKAANLKVGDKVTVAQDAPVATTLYVSDSQYLPTLKTFVQPYSPFHYASYAVQTAGALYALTGIAGLLSSQFEQSKPTTTPTDIKKEQKKRVERVQQENKVWTGFGVYLVGVLAQILIDNTFGAKNPIEINVSNGTQFKLTSTKN